jgi:hypothetical protein
MRASFESHWTGAIARRVSAWLPWLVFLCLGIVSILNALQTNWGIAIGPAQGLVDQANTFAAVFMGIFIEAVPYLLLGTLASGLVEEFVRKEDIARLVPAGSHLTPLIGSLLGLFFPVCECGTVPLTRRLMQKGLPVSVSVAFYWPRRLLIQLLSPAPWLLLGQDRFSGSGLCLLFSLLRSSEYCSALRQTQLNWYEPMISLPRQTWVRCLRRSWQKVCWLSKSHLHRH